LLQNYVNVATFKAVILKGKIHVKEDGTTNLKIRITHNRKADYISTDLYVTPDKTKKGYSAGSNSEYVTDRTTDYISKYQKAYLNLGEKTKFMTVKELKQSITDEKQNEIDFIKFADNYMIQLQAQKKEGSFRAARGLLVNLKAFSPTLYFHQIDSRFLTRFETYLKKQGIENGVQTYMSRFRVIFNKGREYYNDDDRGLIRITNYPFKKYKIRQPITKAQDSCLTVEQMRMFIEHRPVLNRSKLGKDMFMLQTYLIGINTKDLFFTSKPIKGRLRFDRFKTKREYSIKLEPEAIEVIEKYKGKTRLLNLEYANYLNFQKAINKGLTIICDSLHKEFEDKRTPEQVKSKLELDFPRKITSNWSRHTWATIARNDCKINKDDVALCLGHEDKDNKVTDMYIKYDYSIIDESNRKVIDLILSKK